MCLIFSIYRPKIGTVKDQDRKHTKGCNCKRSGCLKNYCECYEAKIPCSGNCKCFGKYFYRYLFKNYSSQY